MAGFRISDCTSQRAAGRLVRLIDRHMRGLIEAELAAIDLTYAQWATLKMTREGEVDTASEVARELGYTSGATTRLIDGLERRRLLDRRPDERDRRVSRLVVTPQGNAAVDRGMPIAVGMWNEMIADFDQHEADQFVETLVKLLASIERRTAGARLPVLEPAE